MSNYPSLLVKRLIINGYRKDYTVCFNPGVNIIYGDADTGKSSILELINYLLGASKFVTYDEIESSADHATLELEINQKPYLIKRDLYDADKPVDVYKCTYSEISSVYPEKYAPSFKRSTAPVNGYLSDLLLDALNLPIVKVRQSPSKSDSSMVRLSFRDIFKYCYLNQDDVGSKRLLDIGNWSVRTKNKQTFKYIFSLLDENITSMEQEISDLVSRKTENQKRYELVSEFLRETDFDTSSKIEKIEEELDDQIEALEDKLVEISKSMTSNSEEYRDLKKLLLNTNDKISNLERDISGCNISIDNYSRLKNEYINDIEKIKAIKLSKEVIGAISQRTDYCPICSSELNEDDIINEFNISDQGSLDIEEKSLRVKVRDLGMLLEHNKNLRKRTSYELDNISLDRDRLRRMLDDESSNMISPYITERDGTLSELIIVKEKKNNLNNILKVRNKQNAILSDIDVLNNKISTLKSKLDKLREQAPSPSEILSSLGIILNKYLSKVHIKNRNNIYIESTEYLPSIRNRPYFEITSGGLRTITSIGFLASLLEYGITHDSNLPRFLMVDTVGKYLGKTKELYTGDTDFQSDIEEDISDPSKYRNIYEYLIDLAQDAEERGKACQIILVDNDVPPNIQEDYSGFVIAHYSSKGERGLPIGLIDDADVSFNSPPE